MKKLTGDDILSVVTMTPTKVLERTPARIYRIRPSMDGLRLVPEERKRYRMPERIYGNHYGYKKRILQSLGQAGNGNMGVLLTGKRGSGKSLLAEDLANATLNSKRPVIIVDWNIDPRQLDEVLEAVGPCMVYMDEFGKVVRDKGEREEYLSLFSNTKYKKVLFVVTANTLWELSPYVIDRPGRFLFRINFKPIDVELAMDILADYSFPEDQRDYLVDYMSTADLSIDVAVSLLTTLSGCDSLDELISFMAMLNIPNPDVREARIIASFRGSQIEDSTILTYANQPDVPAEVTKQLKAISESPIFSCASEQSVQAGIDLSPFHNDELFLINVGDSYYQICGWGHVSPEDYSDTGNEGGPRSPGSARGQMFSTDRPAGRSRAWGY